MLPARVLLGGETCRRCCCCCCCCRRARRDSPSSPPECACAQCPASGVRTECPVEADCGARGLLVGSVVVVVRRWPCWVRCVRACLSDSRARRAPWAAAGARRRRSPPVAATCPHGWPPRTNVSAMRITSAAPSSTR
ncbi:unnamed protein product, partial [Ixodes hexagonus]